MGSCKALLPFGGAPLIRRHVDALAAVASVVIVVTGDAAAAVLAAVPEAKGVHNPRWASTHPIDSLRLALAAAPEAERVLVTPVDVVPATLGTLEALLAARGAAVPVWGGRRGHPVLLDAPTIAAIRAFPPADGLRGALAQAETVAVDDSLSALDFDDPEAYAQVLAAFQRRKAL